MRNRLLASAGVGLFVLTAAVIAHPASAQDCGCREQVRAALKRQSPVASQPVRATAQAQAQASAAAYDYYGARAVDMSAYRQRWEQAPQGPVAPPPGYAPMEYGYAPPAYDMAMASGHYANPAYPDGWAYGYQAQGIEIDQQGWFGGVGYGGPDGGGGGGGGGGMTLTMAQPDASNGYGPGTNGSWGAANQLYRWRAEAFAPKSSGGSK